MCYNHKEVELQAREREEERERRGEERTIHVVVQVVLKSFSFRYYLAKRVQIVASDGNGNITMMHML